ncbi:hypothetical protein TGMAS_415080 [Toxoplasma gondii MAS]|uniref:Uncharacterized protein n=1 Tax=Toxoplasma gondii MAS TaxID=943118 RepID=A0A086QEJ9_TOXGO|nr:hypothetical protein TGMAS_415080 [Toxoplasma gondii MAS]
MICVNSASQTRFSVATRRRKRSRVSGAFRMKSRSSVRSLKAPLEKTNAAGRSAGGYLRFSSRKRRRADTEVTLRAARCHEGRQNASTALYSSRTRAWASSSAFAVSLRASFTKSRGECASPNSSSSLSEKGSARSKGSKSISLTPRPRRGATQEEAKDREAAEAWRRRSRLMAGSRGKQEKVEQGSPDGLDTNSASSPRGDTPHAASAADADVESEDKADKGAVEDGHEKREEEREDEQEEQEGGRDDGQEDAEEEEKEEKEEKEEEEEEEQEGKAFEESSVSLELCLLQRA